MTEEPTKSELGVGGDVEGDVVVAGRDAITRKTIIQQLPLPVIVGGVVVLVIGVVAAALILRSSAQEVTDAVEDVGATLIAPTSTPEPTVTPTPPFAAAETDEVLVIVTDFSGEEAGATSARIYDALRERVEASDLELVRVERLEETAPEMASEAVAIGEQYDATLVIWGRTDQYAFEPHYEIVRDQELIAERADMGAVLMSDLPTFTARIVEDVPNEFEYLMLFSLGQMAMFTRDCEGAITIFDEAAAVDLDRAERGRELGLFALYTYRSVCRLDFGDIENAIADVVIAMQYVDLRLLALVMDLPISLDPQATIEELDQEIALDPENAEAYMRRGFNHGALNNVTAGFVDFERAIELDPTLAEAYLGRGALYASGVFNDDESSSSNLQLALADYARAIEINPQYTTAYLYRGLLYIVIGDYEASLSDINRVIELEPEDYLSYQFRASVYDVLGDNQAAIADYSRFLERYPFNDVLSSIARVRVQQLEDE